MGKIKKNGLRKRNLSIRLKSPIHKISNLLSPCFRRIWKPNWRLGMAALWWPGVWCKWWRVS